MRPRGTWIPFQRPFLAAPDELLRDGHQRCRGRRHAVRGARFARQDARVWRNGQERADEREGEEALEAVEVDVPRRRKERVVICRLGAGGDLVEADAQVALVDDVQGREAVGEAAAVGETGRVPAGRVGGVALDPEAEGAGPLDVGLQWVGGAEGVLEEVAADLGGGVEAVGLELAGGGILEDIPIWEDEARREGCVDGGRGEGVDECCAGVDILLTVISRKFLVGSSVDSFGDFTGVAVEPLFFVGCGFNVRNTGIGFGAVIVA